MSSKPKVAILVNMVAPSRVPVYARLAEAFDLIMLHGGIERNRSGWQGVSVPGARMREVWGWQFSLNRREHGEAYDHWFLHVEPGYFIELLRERPDAVITFEMGFRTLSALAYGAFLGCAYRAQCWQIPPSDALGCGKSGEALDQLWANIDRVSAGSGHFPCPHSADPKLCG